MPEDNGEARGFIIRRRVEVMTGHEIARELIKKHGKDRYPTTELAIMKLVEELGELASAILDGHPGEIEKEYGDVGITLYAVGDKLGLNLDFTMQKVLTEERRTF